MSRKQTADRRPFGTAPRLPAGRNLFAGCILLSLIFLFTGASTASEFLDIGYGARSIGLGRTYTSVKADSYGIFGNPAGLSGITAGEIVSMYGQMNDDIKYTLLGYVMPTKYGKFFAGYGSNQIADITTTTLDAVTGRPAAVTNFDFRDDLLMLGYQNNLSKTLSYGLRLKYYNKGSSLANLTGNGINTDAGVLISVNERLRVGVVGRNIIGTGIQLHNGQTESLPMGVDVGIGLTPHDRIDIYTDLCMTNNIPAEAKLGIEWRLIDRLALRFGLEQRSSGSNSSYINGSTGVGVKLGVLRIDYAYYSDSLLAANSRHFVSFSIAIPGMNAAECGEVKEEPKTVAPVPIKVVPANKVIKPVPVKPIMPVIKTTKPVAAKVKPAATVKDVKEKKIPKKTVVPVKLESTVKAKTTAPAKVVKDKMAPKGAGKPISISKSAKGKVEVPAKDIKGIKDKKAPKKTDKPVGKTNKVKDKKVTGQGPSVAGALSDPLSMAGISLLGVMGLAGLARYTGVVAAIRGRRTKTPKGL